MTKPRFRRNMVYVILGLVALFVIWFWWESYTTNEEKYVTSLVKQAEESAFQSASTRVDPNSYIQMNSNGGPMYWVPIFSPSYQPQYGGQNGFNLQSAFAYYLSQDQGFFHIQSFGIDQFYDHVGITATVKYKFFGVLTGTATAHDTETLKKKPVK